MEDRGFMYWGRSADALTFAVPYPDEAQFQGEDIVDSARTVGGQVVFTKINRTQEKQNMKWKFIAPDVWYEMNRFVRSSSKAFYCRYYSYIFGEWATRMMYAGDPSCTPVLVAKGTNEALVMKDATLNIIDMGM